MMIAARNVEQVVIDDAVTLTNRTRKVKVSFAGVFDATNARMRFVTHVAYQLFADKVQQNKQNGNESEQGHVLDPNSVVIHVSCM